MKRSPHRKGLVALLGGTFLLGLVLSATLAAAVSQRPGIYQYLNASGAVVGGYVIDCQGHRINVWGTVTNRSTLVGILYCIPIDPEI